jgi:hypothetical protein
MLTQLSNVCAGVSTIRPDAMSLASDQSVLVQDAFVEPMFPGVFELSLDVLTWITIHVEVLL